MKPFFTNFRPTFYFNSIDKGSDNVFNDIAKLKAEQEKQAVGTIKTIKTKLSHNDWQHTKGAPCANADQICKEYDERVKDVESIKTNSDGDKVVECVASEYKEQSKEFKLEWNVNLKELNNFLCENTNLPLNCLQIEINEDEYTIYIFLDDGTKLVGASGDSLIALDNGEIDFKSYLDEYKEDIEAIKEYEKNKDTEEFTSFEDVAKEVGYDLSEQSVVKAISAYEASEIAVNTEENKITFSEIMKKIESEAKKGNHLVRFKIATEEGVKAFLFDKYLKNMGYEVEMNIPLSSVIVSWGSSLHKNIRTE